MDRPFVVRPQAEVHLQAYSRPVLVGLRAVVPGIEAQGRLTRGERVEFRNFLRLTAASIDLQPALVTLHAIIPEVDSRVRLTRQQRIEFANALRVAADSIDLHLQIDAADE